VRAERPTNHPFSRVAPPKELKLLGLFRRVGRAGSVVGLDPLEVICE
jgi:hypothetical protein